MKVSCPSCQAIHDVGGFAPDSVVQCSCGQAFRVPAQTQPSPAYQPPPPVSPPGSTYSPVQQQHYSQGGYTQPIGGVHQGPTKPTPGIAVASLILGIVSIFFCPIIMNIPGLILGYSGKSKIDANPEQFGGRGVALAGIIVNWIAFALYAVIIAFGIFVGILGASV